MKFMVDEMEADKVRCLLEAADVNYIHMVEKIDVDPKLARQSARNLRDAFVWSQSNEGYEYWDTVYKKLIKYAETEEK